MGGHDAVDAGWESVVILEEIYVYIFFFGSAEWAYQPVCWGIFSIFFYQIKQQHLFLKTTLCPCYGNSSNVNFYSIISVDSNTPMLN